jgi:hypothetical protein
MAWPLGKPGGFFICVDTVLRRFPLKTLAQWKYRLK